MIKAALLIALAAMLSGCMSLGGRTSYVEAPDGRMWKVRCQSDGKVAFKNSEVSLDVDNRGPLGQVWAAATASLGKVYDKVKGEPEVVK